MAAETNIVVQARTKKIHPNRKANKESEYESEEPLAYDEARKLAEKYY